MPSPPAGITALDVGEEKVGRHMLAHSSDGDGAPWRPEFTSMEESEKALQTMGVL